MSEPVNLKRPDVFNWVYAALRESKRTKNTKRKADIEALETSLYILKNEPVGLVVYILEELRLYAHSAEAYENSLVQLAQVLDERIESGSW